MVTSQMTTYRLARQVGSIHGHDRRRYVSTRWEGRSPPSLHPKQPGGPRPRRRQRRADGEQEGSDQDGRAQAHDDPGIDDRVRDDARR